MALPQKGRKTYNIEVHPQILEKAANDADYLQRYDSVLNDFDHYVYHAAALDVLYVLRKSRYYQFSPVEDSYEQTKGNHL